MSARAYLGRDGKPRIELGFGREAHVLTFDEWAVLAGEVRAALRELRATPQPMVCNRCKSPCVRRMARPPQADEWDEFWGCVACGHVSVVGSWVAHAAGFPCHACGKPATRHVAPGPTDFVRPCCDEHAGATVPGTVGESDR